MSGCLTMSSMLWNASAAPYFSAEAFAVASCAVHTAFNSYSGNACSAGTCALAPQPLPPGVTLAPTIPTRDLSAMSPLLPESSDDGTRSTPAPDRGRLEPRPSQNRNAGKDPGAVTASAMLRPTAQIRA